jgi:hypothetical protein
VYLGQLRDLLFDSESVDLYSYLNGSLNWCLHSMSLSHFLTGDHQLLGTIEEKCGGDFILCAKRQFLGV